VTLRPGDHILIRAKILSVGPDGWMTVRVPCDHGTDQRLIINAHERSVREEEPALELESVEERLNG